MITINDLLALTVAVLLLAVAAVWFLKKGNYPRWTRIVGSVAIGALALVAVFLGISSWALKEDYRMGREIGLVGSYRLALDRAVFMDQRARGERFDTPDADRNVPLCQPGMLSTARELVADRKQPSCAVVKWNRQAKAGCEGRPRGDCVTFLIDPSLYLDADLRPLILSALKDPCQLFWPIDELRARSARFYEAEKQQPLGSEEWKQNSDLFSLIQTQLEARKDLDCDISKPGKRAVALTLGDKREFLELP